MSLEGYLKNLDLSAGSTLAKELFAKLDSEASNERITLSPAYSTDSTPAYLTPAMSTWYNGRIQSVRVSAVQEIIEAFHALAAPNSNVRGKLLEYELDRIESEAYQKAAEERKQFERDTNITDLHRELSLEQQRYETLVQERGEAVKARPVLYWAVLVLMISFLEGLLNLESFLKIPGFTPMLSVGSFAVVTVAFGASAHIVGMFLKQWRERFGGGVSGTERWKNRVVLLAIAEPLFFLAFAYVVYARWALLADVVLRKSQTTGAPIGTWELVLFGGTLLGNIIVYVMGIAWSYFRHDAYPGFSELRRRVETLQATESSLIGDELGKRIRQHFSKAQQLKENARHAERAQALQLNGYQSGRNLFNRLREQDARVVGLLKEYKSALLTKADEDHSVTFIYADVAKVALDPQMELSAAQYGSMPIDFRYA